MTALKVSLIVLLCTTITSVLGKSFFEWDTILPVNNEQRTDTNGEKFKRRAFNGGNDQRIFALSELIDNIESGLVRSALSVGSVVSSTNSNPTVMENDDSKSEHQLARRLTVDEKKNDQNSSNGDTKETTEKIEGVNGQPSQMIVDKINVYKLPVGIIPLPTFMIRDSLKSTSTEDSKKDTSTESSEVNQDAKVSSTTNKLETITTQANEQTLGATIVSTEAPLGTPKLTSTDKSSVGSTVVSTNGATVASTDSTTPATTEATITAATSASSSTSLPITSKASSTTLTTSAATTTTSSTTTTSTTTTQPTSTTTKTPIVELKEAEEDLKEKVAEIEADPIILSARV